MRHRKAGRSLRRTSEQRLALLRNLATSLIEQGAVETTEAKAKELRPFVEKLVTLAKRGDLIVIGHRHLSRLERLFEPSIGQWTIYHAPCPVLVETRDPQP